MIDLYILESCPYSQKVMEFLEENNIAYNKHDVRQPENYEALLELGGKGQVPFLHDKEKDVKMYESDKIIDYIKENA